MLWKMKNVSRTGTTEFNSLIPPLLCYPSLTVPALPVWPRHGYKMSANLFVCSIAWCPCHDSLMDAFAQARKHSLLTPRPVSSRHPLVSHPPLRKELAKPTAQNLHPRLGMFSSEGMWRSGLPWNLRGGRVIFPACFSVCGTPKEAEGKAKRLHTSTVLRLELPSQLWPAFIFSSKHAYLPQFYFIMWGCSYGPKW